MTGLNFAKRKLSSTQIEFGFWGKGSQGLLMEEKHNKLRSRKIGNLSKQTAPRKSVFDSTSRRPKVGEMTQDEKLLPCQQEGENCKCPSFSFVGPGSATKTPRDSHDDSLSEKQQDNSPSCKASCYVTRVNTVLIHNIHIKMWLRKQETIRQ